MFYFFVPLETNKPPNLMKKIFFLFLLITSFAHSQEVNHEPESTTIVGLWSLSGTKLPNGEIFLSSSGNYKIFNADNTFYTFIVWDKGRNLRQEIPTTIGLYGTYIKTGQTEDGFDTYTEHIKMHFLNPKMNNSESEVRCQLHNKNTLYFQFKNKTLNGNHWTTEVWSRVAAPVTFTNNQSNTQSL